MKKIFLLLFSLFTIITFGQSIEEKKSNLLNEFSVITSYSIHYTKLYENATQLVFGSYMLRLGIRSMGITLIAAAFFSLIALAFITRNLRKIVLVIRRFKEGDLIV